MSAYVRNLKFVNFKLYFPLTYNPEIGTELSACESDSHLTDFFIFCHVLCGDKAHVVG